MDNILNLLEELTQPDNLGPEYRALLEKTGPLTDRLTELTSIEFMDEHFNATAAVMIFERQECFARGFRLGARLILALAEPCAPDTRHSS